MKKKPYLDKPRICDPGMCSNCQYIGEGDMICDHPKVTRNGEPVLVVEDWSPNENYMKCKRGAKRNDH